MDRDQLKRQAGRAAAVLVTDGMVVGLGTGSTVRHTIEALGERVASGLRMQGVPTSEASRQLAESLRIPLCTLEDCPEIDLTIDGADEVDPQLRLIKGGGGALAREKVVAAASRRMVVVADEAKWVERLGSTFALPVEVLDFARPPVRRALEGWGAQVSVRQAPGGGTYRTDNGHPILDARFPAIPDPPALEERLNSTPGVVCTGLFLDLCDEVYLATSRGVERRRSGGQAQLLPAA